MTVEELLAAILGVLEHMEAMQERTMIAEVGAMDAPPPLDEPAEQLLPEEPE